MFKATNSKTLTILRIQRFNLVFRKFQIEIQKAHKTMVLYSVTFYLLSWEAIKRGRIGRKENLELNTISTRAVKMKSSAQGVLQ